MGHSFTATQWIPRPVEEVFAFFANPQNLILLMPQWNKARIEQAEIVPAQVASRDRRVAAGAGSFVTISFRPFPLSPIRWQWKAEISEFAWNDHFCDEQLRGPFAYWKHCHRLQAESRDGMAGTVVTDTVVYEMKMGRLGELAHALFTAPQIKALFAYRHAQVERIFGGKPG
jgi:ligand-binding SRPBCC domain-containing protein